jgi:DNA-directed RNA polymerase subunit RPC12/RpoP
VNASLQHKKTSGAPILKPVSTGTGNAGIVSVEPPKEYIRSTCLKCWQKVVIAWKKGDYLKDKECPLCGGRLLGKMAVKKGDPDYHTLDADATQAVAFPTAVAFNAGGAL